MSEDIINNSVDAVPVMYYSALTNGFYDSTFINLPKDAVEITVQEWNSLIQGQANGMSIGSDAKGYPILKERETPTLTATYAYLEIAVQAYLDAGAQKWGYNSMVTAVSYAASTNTQYAADASALANWRDAVWEWTYVRYQTVVAGEAVADFMDGIPVQPSKPVV